MKQKTPMQILFEKYGHLLPNIEKEFYEKERQAIIDAHSHGIRFITGNTSIPQPESENYFNQTYKS